MIRFGSILFKQNFGISSIAKNCEISSVSALSTKPPKKKHFNSQDILRTLSETYPTDYLSSGRPQINHNPPKHLARIDAMALSAADYFGSKNLHFFQHDWIENTTSAYQNICIEEWSLFDKIMVAINLKQLEDIPILLTNCEKNENSDETYSGLNEEQLQYIFAKYTYAVLSVKKEFGNFQECRERIRVGSQIVQMMKNNFGIETSSETNILTILESAFCEQSFSFSDLLTQHSISTNDINVVNLIFSVSQTSHKCLEELIKYLHKLKIKPNQETFALILSVILAGSISETNEKKFSECSVLLYEMSVLNITPSAEFWGKIYISLVCHQKVGLRNQMATKVFEKFLNEASGAKISYFFCKQFSRVYDECRTVDEVNYITSSLKPHNLSNYKGRLIVLEACVRSIIAHGNLNETWDCINKYVLPGNVPIKEASLITLLYKAVAEKQYDFLPVVYALAVKFYQSSQTQFTMCWAKSALSCYDVCDNDTKIQFHAIGKGYLSLENLNRSTPRHESRPKTNDLNLFIQLLLKANDVKAMETAVYNIKNKRMTRMMDESTMSQCLQLALTVGDEDLVKKLKSNFESNRKLSFDTEL